MFRLSDEISRSRCLTEIFRDKEEELLRSAFSHEDPRCLGAHPSRISWTPGAFAEFLFATGEEIGGRRKEDEEMEE